MTRYVVKVAAGERTVSLLVVLSSSQLCSALLDAVKARLPTVASKLGLTDTDNLQITLHLNEIDGPILDFEDLLCDVIHYSDEVCFAVIQTQKEGVPPPSHLPSSKATNTREHLRIRVITPEMARSHANINDITPLREPIALKCTLQDLRWQVSRHLGLDEPSIPSFECNCDFALQIDHGATLNTHGSVELDALHTLVVVYGDSQVTTVHIEEPTLSSMKYATKSQLKSRATEKILEVKGGIEDDSAYQTRRYLKLPVMAVCSPQSHGKLFGDDYDDDHDSESFEYETDDEMDSYMPDESDFGEPDRRPRIDIHISECPIEITLHNADVTLAAANLDDCAIEGVLNVFAVPRLCLMDNNARAGNISVGKAEIFRAHLSWEMPCGQSERGLANLLSSLRVFADLTSASNMEANQQDSVLHVIHLLTRFPPAVRTMHILMRGETPSLSERAALSQCFYEILKDVVPIRVIKSDHTRYLEGTRLLLGLILEKSKHIKLLPHDSHAILPYVSMSVFDLRSADTMKPVRGIPVQTQSGLLETGTYNAFVDKGILNWNNGRDSSRIHAHDAQWNRVAILSGGAKSKVVTFSADAAAFSLRYADRGDVNNVITKQDYSSLLHLASLCSRNGLGVSPPSTLSSVTPPVLTFDREGSLAVYVGREACGGNAGRDILMFRPIAGDEAVDTAIITQLLEPILARRKADGTAVFEAFGDHHRQTKDPDEAVMLCVDLSTSMNERCGLVDIEESEDTDASVNLRPRADFPSSASHLVENKGGERLAFDELKEYLISHESFGDFIAIIRSGEEPSAYHANAQKVLEILAQLDRQQIESDTEELYDAKLHASSVYYRSQLSDIELRLSTVTNRSVRMKRFNNSLVAFLVYRAENAGSIPDIQTWRPGAPIPRASRKEAVYFDGPTFNVPVEYLCPISSEMMQDPVSTVDGFTYERNNIERWFQTHTTSPLTNVVLSDLDLRPNVQLKQDIIAFIAGTSITSKFSESQSQVVSIKSPLDAWSMTLPHETTMQALYELVFRRVKGRYHRFELHHNDILLPMSQATVLQTINPSSDIIVNPVETEIPATASMATDDFFLVKIYYQSMHILSHAYWESKYTTKTLASSVFSYYRLEFSQNPSTIVFPPFTIWRGMRDIGDGEGHGYPEYHWQNLSGLLNRQKATGSLNDEPVLDVESTESGRDSSHLQDQQLVLKIWFGDPPANRDRKILSRLDVLKQTFESFINRILAYNFQTHIGLVTFGTTASLLQKATHAIENFRHQLNNTTAGGNTALWSGIALADDHLLRFHQKFPKARLRIICISDGEDNMKDYLVHNLAAQLAQANVVVDSICLGDANNKDLQTLSYMTGGYKFQPQTLEEAMAICEMEPVLSLLERPDAALPEISSRHARNALFRFQKARQDVVTDHVTQNQFPERKEHPQLAQSFIELGHFARQNSTQTRSDNNERISRIHTELRNCGARPHPFYDIYICEPNFGLWKVVMQGPPDSSYTGGTFLLYIEMGVDYPIFPPSARFVTPVYHPNINRHGRICHSILDRNWTVDTTTKDVIDPIYSLLLVPEFSDPINTVVTLNYHWDEVQFQKEVRRSIQQHAKKTRAEWRKEIIE